MERISSYQLFSMTVLFQVGTTIIFGFSSSAGRDAWISCLISTGIGVLTVSLYLFLMKSQPGLTLVEWFPAQFGRWIGTPIAWMYPLLFIYDAGRAMGDIKDLISVTILPLTPHFVIMIALLAVIAYALYGGIENLARIGGIWMPIMLFLYLIVVVLIAVSGIIDFRNIQPFVDKGWGNVMKAVWPLGITQTFGESIEFAMIWPLVKEEKKIVKYTLVATMTSGLLICSIDIFAILVLSEKYFSNSLYPIYTLVQQIEVSDFIENLDSISVILFLTTAFFKTGLHIFSAVYGMQKLLKTKSYKTFILPVTAAVAFLALTMARSVLEHFEAGLKILPYNLWVPLFYILPALLFIVVAIKRLKQVKQKNAHS
ncbi:GerAB/ArcD/ProY family transporter [Caproiciproducens faecalis]|uniref:Endospore germination permease n=1 Tax=Caproiciproducens faecalis TaxID=2820301 RepID=A0ABS7DL57_9FIRM|nr:endospore germination permease [Caproiciproducens faecalis]MBW7572010.1 endospore germination permease [Caproiciproducens faecalis]